MMRIATALLLLLLLAACSGGGDDEASATTDAPEAVPVELDVSEIVGYWSGDFGDMVLVADGDEVRGAYTHDEGTVLGTFDGTTFRGWWCEVPSRLPDDDAGYVEFVFLRIDGELLLDGWWTYGSDGEPDEDWDLVEQTGLGPDVLRARLDEPDLFCSP
jgi:hypothetical protein